MVWACYNTSIRQVGPRYLNIASELRSKIIDGTFGANQVIPSEAVLSTQFEASRITIRKALEVLRQEGYVDSRQGFGWLVVSPPLRQSLGRFSTIEDQMAEIGVRPRRKVLDSEICEPLPQISQVLGEQEMLRVRRINLADEVPFARVTVWIPSILAKDFSLGDYERSSFYELLTTRRVIKRPLSRAVQTISAIAISDEDARLLVVPVGSPALRCSRTTYDSAGEAILFSEYIFPGHLTEFVIELVGGVTSMAPSGLRLVD